MHRRFSVFLVPVFQAWACGNFEYLAITTNGGGTTFPKALYHYDISATCATGQVQLLNECYQDYTYRWAGYQKNSMFISTAATEYT